MISRMFQVLYGVVAFCVILTCVPSVSAQEVVRIVEPAGSCTDMDGVVHEYSARAHPRGPDGLPDLKTWQCAAGRMKSYGPVDQAGVYLKLDETGFWQGKLAYDPSNEGWKYYVEKTATPVATSTPQPTGTAVSTSTPAPTQTPQATTVPQQPQYRTFTCPDGSYTGDAESYYGYYGSQEAAFAGFKNDHCQVEAWTCYWGANVAGHMLNEVNTNSDMQSHVDFGSKEAWLAQAELAGCYSQPQESNQSGLVDVLQPAEAAQPEASAPTPAATATPDPSIPHVVCYRDRDEYKPVVMSKWEYEEMGWNTVRWQAEMLAQGCSPIYDHSTKPVEPPSGLAAISLPGIFGALGFFGTTSLTAGFLVFVVGFIWTLYKGATMNTGSFAARLGIGSTAVGIWFVEGLLVSLCINAATSNVRAASTLLIGALMLGSILTGHAIFDTSVQKSGKNHAVLDVGGYIAVIAICWTIVPFVFMLAARDGIFR